MIEALIIFVVVHVVLFIINPDFFIWCILGAYVMIGAMFYDMYQSRKDKDIASQSRRILQEDIHRYEEIVAKAGRNRV